MRLYKILYGVFFIVMLSSCCHTKKQGQKAAPPAKDILIDRNTKDPNIDSLQKPVEVVAPKINFE
ncbi:MAG: hypothetical protein ACK5NK_02690 [Niabella sp.]